MVLSIFAITFGMNKKEKIIKDDDVTLNENMLYKDKSMAKSCA